MAVKLVGRDDVGLSGAFQAGYIVMTNYCDITAGWGTILAGRSFGCIIG